MQSSSAIRQFSVFPPNILLSTLFSNTLSVCSSPNLRDKVSHPYKTTGKIIYIFYILIFKFFDRRWEDKRFRTERYQAFPKLNVFLISS
jgi:hypothetical protein